LVVSQSFGLQREREAGEPGSRARTRSTTVLLGLKRRYFWFSCAR
jgi:hypothetical protein